LTHIVATLTATQQVPDAHGAGARATAALACCARLSALPARPAAVPQPASVPIRSAAAVNASTSNLPTAFGLVVPLARCASLPSGSRPCVPYALISGS
jgi:hypothetical protein